MPSWKIHSKIASDISKIINTNKKYFMIGNLLPDQDKYNIEGLNKNISRTITHYVTIEDLKIGINLPDYERFYNKYKSKMKNPVILGYLVHLLTDYYWNNYIYKKYFIKEKQKYVAVKLNSNKIYKCDFKEMNSIKQEDFEIFENLLTVRKNNFKYCLNSKYFNELEEIKINKHNIYLMGKYLNLTYKKKNNIKEFKILTEDECYIIIDECKKFIINYLVNKNLI